MRKKDLQKLNQELYKKIQNAEEQIATLKNENSELVQKIEEMENQIKELQNPQPELIEKSEPNADEYKAPVYFEDDKQYAASIIGKIVVEAARFCNSLTTGENPDVKELVNLILGRTEVAKAEILKIVSSDLQYSEKISKIDCEQNEAIDYFKSVMAQRD